MSNTTTAAKKWDEEATQALVNLVGGDTSQVVLGSTVLSASEQLEVPVRSIAAKLRKLGFTVESMAKVKASTFSADETELLSSFVNENAGELTYKEIAENFLDGKFTAKQVQGKLLALELTGAVRPSDKVEAASKYTADEEDTFVEMARNGESLEKISEALGKTLASARGKGLSLMTKGLIDSIPVQEESYAKASVDAIDSLGEAIATMTVAEIAASTGKTERGIKTSLTRRGIKVADYDGKAKHDKAKGKAAVNSTEESC